MDRINTLQHPGKGKEKKLIERRPKI